MNIRNDRRQRALALSVLHLALLGGTGAGKQRQQA